MLSGAQSDRLPKYASASLDPSAHSLRFEASLLFARRKLAPIRVRLGTQLVMAPFPTRGRSTGCPAWTHASIPPRSGRIFVKPACLRCFAAVAADSSLGHAQYTTISFLRR